MDGNEYLISSSTIARNDTNRTGPTGCGRTVSHPLQGPAAPAYASHLGIPCLRQTSRHPSAQIRGQPLAKPKTESRDLRGHERSRCTVRNPRRNQRRTDSSIHAQTDRSLRIRTEASPHQQFHRERVRSAGCHSSVFQSCRIEACWNGYTGCRPKPFREVGPLKGAPLLEQIV